MIQSKPCKGNGKSKGSGCGKSIQVEFRKYGLCQSCYATWLYSTEEGTKQISKLAIKSKKINDKRKREVKRELNVSSAMRLADTYFSRYIRLKHSTDGDCTCYTCGTDKPIKEVDNGHYLKREHKATRYHENNCRPQCKTCNGDTKHNGKQAEFRVNLSYEIGEQHVVELETLARTTISANYIFYRELSDKYREKVNELQKQLKVKYW